MGNKPGYYQEMGPFGTGFWVGYGGGMAVMFWGALILGLIWGDWSSADAESATSGMVFMNIIAVLMGIGHAETASRSATQAAQRREIPNPNKRAEATTKPRERNGGKGLDPEYVAIAGEMGAIYIKAGARRFRVLLRALMEDVGLSFDMAQRYGRGAYNDARDTMELAGEDISGMDASVEVIAEIKSMMVEDAAGASEDAGKGVKPNYIHRSVMNPDAIISWAKEQDDEGGEDPARDKLAANFSLQSEDGKKRLQQMGRELAALGMAMDKRAQMGLPKIPSLSKTHPEQESQNSENAVANKKNIASSATHTKILWTPEGATMGIGTVLMERPTKPLTLDQYRGALSTMIDRMVHRAGPEEARRLLGQTAEIVEGLSVTRNLEDAGTIMVFESEHLMERAGMLSPDWPVPLSKINQRVDLTGEELEERTLEEFLGIVYPEST